jgi:hypothetical protein
MPERSPEQLLDIANPAVNTARTEIIVIDNHPHGPAGEALRKLETLVKNYRDVPVTRIQETSVREAIFREAAGDFVLCMA